MAVQNPFYQRIEGLHPTRPKITGEHIIVVIRLYAAQTITGTEANSIIGEFSFDQDPATGVITPRPLDQTEQDQALDLVTTATTLSGAARLSKLNLIADTLFMLAETTRVGWRSNDMTGTTVGGAIGGKMGVVRRDGP